MEDKIIHVVCALLFHNETVLITRRAQNMDHAMQWEFPGGKIQNGENEFQAIQRELQEELNISVRIFELLPSIEHTYPSKKIRLYPLISRLDIKPEIQLKEHEEFKWVKPEQLFEVELCEADRKLISMIIEKCTSVL